ncbi:hypothetical protein [Candidatus Nitrosocosmicus arcticus]|uniref:Uncharacterized protein n=1 Tax=Candidatus Nitrosocosmicus arcticus TaxID=2035267 RepID=A0A557SU79_9ARCH|nr:hypothetical protein [Candidatus Nitrosocosmicus arcticus]TVP40162.1 hypothetical protein NARC_90068 [Candidatus Nitrosocosmicus arcticus]
MKIENSFKYECNGKEKICNAELLDDDNNQSFYFILVDKKNDGENSLISNDHPNKKVVLSISSKLICCF